ncbi:hypothetical protein [Rhizobium aouanii]|uniref:hypothetical protein n=1 Tax=Rhizobium aouanii TaxID=3118145 RepID=UPI003004A053
MTVFSRRRHRDIPRAGISHSELARRMGKSEKEARRLLDPDVSTKLPLHIKAGPRGDIYNE